MLGKTINRIKQYFGVILGIMLKVIYKIERYFGISKESIPDLRALTAARIALYFPLSYLIAWCSYLPVYFYLLPNYLAGYSVLFLGLVSSSAGLITLKRTKKVKLASAWANTGGGLTLLGITAATGGAWSPIFGWQFVASIATFLCQGAKAGFAISLFLALSSAGLAIYLQPIDASKWGFAFDLHSQWHAYFNAFTICGSILLAAVVTWIFDKNLHSALEVSEIERQKADEARAKTLTVMDLTDASVISFDASYNITSKNSHCNAAFGEVSTFKQVIEKMEVAKKAEMEATIFAAIGDSNLNFEINAGNLPIEAVINGRHHMIKWAPLLDHNDNILEIVVTLTDDEDVRQKHAKDEADRNLSTCLFLLAELGPEKSCELIDFVDNAIAKAKLHIPKGERAEAYRELHTIKGITRSFKFEKLAAVIHETESALGNPEEAIRLLDVLSGELDVLKEASRKLRFDNKYVVVGKDELDKALSNSSERALLMSMRYKTLETVLTSYAHTLPGEAKKRSLPTPGFNARCPQIYLQPECVNALNKAFVHIIGNALDHGIEPEQERRQKGKNPIGSISIVGTAGSDGIKIRVSDDGRGIAIRKIFEKGAQKGLLDPTRQYQANDIANLIFLSEFSTRESVSTTAGRGVGMDAVKAAIEEIGGTIKAEVYSDDAFAAWELIIELPNSSFAKA